MPAIIAMTLFLPSSIPAQYHFRRVFRVFAKRYTVPLLHHERNGNIGSHRQTNVHDQ